MPQFQALRRCSRKFLKFVVCSFSLSPLAQERHPQRHRLCCLPCRPVTMSTVTWCGTSQAVLQQVFPHPVLSVLRVSVQGFTRPGRHGRHSPHGWPWQSQAQHRSLQRQHLLPHGIVTSGSEGPGAPAGLGARGARGQGRIRTGRVAIWVTSLLKAERNTWSEPHFFGSKHHVSSLFFTSFREFVGKPSKADQGTGLIVLFHWSREVPRRITWHSVEFG